MPELIDTQVVFKNFPLTLALRTSVYRRVIRLQRAYGRIVRCTVTALTPQRRQHVGNPHNVRVSLLLPRGQVITTFAMSPGTSQPNLEIALRDAFASARRQLRTLVDRRRGRALETRGVGLRKLDQESRRLRSASTNSWRRSPTRGAERAQSKRVLKSGKRSA